MPYGHVVTISSLGAARLPLRTLKLILNSAAQLLQKTRHIVDFHFWIKDCHKVRIGLLLMLSTKLLNFL